MLFFTVNILRHEFNIPTCVRLPKRCTPWTAGGGGGSPIVIMSYGKAPGSARPGMGEMPRWEGEIARVRLPAGRRDGTWHGSNYS